MKKCKFLITIFLFWVTILNGDTLFLETFDSQKKFDDHWIKTLEGDISEYFHSIKNSDKVNDDFRLCLGMGTRRTDDKTLKYIGVRYAKKIDFNKKGSVSFDLDWNNQQNGCYLSAGCVLSPCISSTNPLLNSAWMKIEYIGVPPGLNARLMIVIKVDDKETTLYDEGWPIINKGGRLIGKQIISINIINKQFVIKENGKAVYNSGDKLLPFESGYLYLHMSSHSNYNYRELYFDNVRIE